MAKIWTIEKMVTAAMQHDNGQSEVQIGRKPTQSKLFCNTQFTNSGIIVQFTHMVEDASRPTYPADAEALLRGQKALTKKPKVSKPSKTERKMLEAADKQAKTEAKRAKKEARADAPAN